MENSIENNQESQINDSSTMTNGKKNTKKAGLILIILGLLVIFPASVFGYLLLTDQLDFNNEKENIEEIEEENVVWENYSSDSFGISFKYPSTYVVVESEKNVYCSDVTHYLREVNSCNDGQTISVPVLSIIPNEENLDGINKGLFINIMLSSGMGGGCSNQYDNLDYYIENEKHSHHLCLEDDVYISNLSFGDELNLSSSSKYSTAYIKLIADNSSLLSEYKNILESIKILEEDSEQENSQEDASNVSEEYVTVEGIYQGINSQVIDGNVDYFSFQNCDWEKSTCTYYLVDSESVSYDESDFTIGNTYSVLCVKTENGGGAAGSSYIEMIDVSSISLISESSTSTDWNTYNSTEYGFSFKYDGEIRENNFGGDEFLTLGTQYSDRYDFTWFVMDGSEISFDDFVDSYANDLLISKEVVVKGEIGGTLLTFEGYTSTLDADRAHLEFFINSGNDVYHRLRIYSDEIDMTSECEDVFNLILENVTF